MHPPPRHVPGAEEDQVTLLAAATSELFKKEVQAYSPLLAPQQPAARLIAARTLHEVYGARMLPWLIGGGRPCPPRQQKSGRVRRSGAAKRAQGCATHAAVAPSS